MRLWRTTKHENRVQQTSYTETGRSVIQASVVGDCLKVGSLQKVGGWTRPRSGLLARNKFRLPVTPDSLQPLRHIQGPENTDGAVNISLAALCVRYSHGKDLTRFLVRLHRLKQSALSGRHFHTVDSC